MKIYNIILSLFLINSCSNYIKSQHAKFDKSDALKNRTSMDKFSYYKHNNTSKNKKNYIPSIKRNYIPQKEAKKRYKENDLNDNSSEKSLWTNENGDINFLYSENNKKSLGDIIVLLVNVGLKNDITSELRRTFPDKPDKNNKIKKKSPRQANPTNISESNEKVYDKITTVVIDEINKNHILIKGRKYLLFKNKKRLVEVQALIGRGDIESDDTVLSDKILEHNIIVQR